MKNSIVVIFLVVTFIVFFIVFARTILPILLDPYGNGEYFGSEYKFKQRQNEPLKYQITVYAEDGAILEVFRSHFIVTHAGYVRFYKPDGTSVEVSGIYIVTQLLKEKDDEDSET